MVFTQPIVDVIRKRISVRKYAARPMDDAEIVFLEELIASLPAPPFGSKSRFLLVAPDAGHNLGQLPSTYGVIRGAKMYLIGAAENSSHALLDFGYQMEYIILRAWDRGLGTCWLGGTFQRSPVERYADLPSGYLIPAISPVGYSAESEGIVDHVLHRIMGSKQRRPFQELFFTGDWQTPLEPEENEAIGIALEMVRLGPSAVNKQPWRILVKDDMMHFFLQKKSLTSRMYKGIFPLVDIGIACCHFDLTMQEQGRKGIWLETELGRALENDQVQYCISWQQSAHSD